MSLIEKSIKKSKILEKTKTMTPEEICELGEKFMFGEGVEKNIDIAIELFKMAKDIAKSCRFLGVIYDSEKGYKNKEKATYFYEQSASLGDVNAIVFCGMRYLAGLGVQKDYKKAKMFFEKAKAMGNAHAIFNLAIMYHEGLGVKKDLTKAVKNYELASSLGSLNAKYSLGVMYYNGEEIGQDYVKAKSYFEQASNLGVSGAKLYLGYMYGEGKGVEQDILKEKQYYEEASKLGNVTASFNLGLSCHDEKDYTKAINYFKQCINNELSNDDYSIEVYVMLTICYLELYYEALANIDSKKRSKKNILQQQKYKEEAKKYLQLAEDNKHVLTEKGLADFEKQIKLYKSILEDNVELANMSYQDFKKKFFNKHSNIFLLADKHEIILYKGIQEYFNKREEDYLQKIITEAVEERTRQLRYVIKRKYPDLEIAKVDEMVQLRSRQIEEEIKDNTIVDFSGCVLDIDKYLEETTKLIFVDYYNEEIPNIIKEKMKENVSKVQDGNEVVSTEFLKQIVEILNKQPVPDDYTREKCISRIADFISFAKTRSKKLYPSIIMENLKDYLEQNETMLNNEEKEFIQNMLDSGKLKLELFEFEDKDSNHEDKENFFTLGNLFYLTFVEQSILLDGKTVTKRVLDKNIVDYVQSINPAKERDEIELKLKELINKIELFRVVVRNVASHVTPLSQKSIEDGLNICIMQDNSIFALMDELFGEYILQKYIEKQNIQSLT